MVEARDVCAAFDKAPHLPAAGTSLVPALNEKVQADYSFSGNLITLHAMDLFLRYSIQVCESSGPPVEWDA